jgi:hypothetical protein
VVYSALSTKKREGHSDPLNVGQALPGDKSNISRSLRTLEAREWIVIERTAGGKAPALYLTREGLKKATEICRKLSLRDKRFINSRL